MWPGSKELLDDTDIFASSRESMLEKLKLLKQCTDEIGMTMHPTKSQFLTVNTNDKQACSIDDVSVSYTSGYMYLGTPILNATAG